MTNKLTSAALLAQISMQLNRFTVNQNLANSTQPRALTSPFEPTRAAVRINALWFSALICSIASASIGITVKQWLNQLLSGLEDDSHETARLRQYRYDNLIKWKVPEIIMLLPILLQIALVLFLIGLADLLCTLHPVLAGIAMGVMSPLLLFLLFTVILPSFFNNCSYQSPQSWGLLLMLQWILRFLRSLTMAALSQFEAIATALAFRSWLYSRQSYINLHYRLWMFGRGGDYRHWREREAESVRTQETILDQHLLSISDMITMNDKFLEKHIRPCFNDLPVAASIACYDKIIQHHAEHLEDRHNRVWPASLGTTSVHVALKLSLDVLQKLCVDGEELEPQRKHIIELAGWLWYLIPDSVEASMERAHCDVLLDVIRLGYDSSSPAFKSLELLSERTNIGMRARNGGYFSVPLETWLNSFACGSVAATMDALSARPHLHDDPETFLETCIIALRVATSGYLRTDDSAFVHASTLKILDQVREYLASGEYRTLAFTTFLYKMSRLYPRAVDMARRYPGVVPWDVLRTLHDAVSEANERVTPAVIDGMGRKDGEAVLHMFALAMDSDHHASIVPLRPDAVPQNIGECD